MTLTRRTFITALAAAPLLAAPARARDILSKADFRGTLDAARHGVQPGAGDLGTAAFNALLRSAAERSQPVFLPPGTYELSGIELPDHIRLEGVPGATRLLYSGEGRFLRALGAKRVTLANLVIDGANKWLADDQAGLVDIREVGRFEIDNCDISGASKFALAIEKSAGSIRGNTITGAAESGIYTIECTGFDIADNHVSGCGNGGILVHRWKAGADGSMITGNRISAIGARSGGTGQNGNGINIFRAEDVIVANNHISDCAFTAIRANSASNVQITANHCLNSGETAIYSEFSFEGAMIANNLIDGAANGIASVNMNEGGRLAAISGNIVRNLRLTAPYEMDGNYFGIGISAEADAVLTGNLVENAPRWGMVLGWGPYLGNVSVTGNVIRRAGVGIAVSVVEGAGTTLIHDNLFAEIGGEAVAGFRWADKATGDLVMDGASGYPHLDIADNRRA